MPLKLTPGETLRIHRERRKLRRPAAAKLIGCSDKYLLMIERGEVSSIGLEIAFAIQREFGIPATDWLPKKSAPRATRKAAA